MKKKNDQSTIMEISQVFGVLSQFDCQCVLWNNASWRVLLPSFSQSAISEKHYLWRTSFPSKCLKFDVDSRNGIKNWEKLFHFSNSCIWIGHAKFWQSRTKYFPSALNVLTLTPKISPITRGDIFRINLPENYEKTW